MLTHVIVVGGGPAGMITALTAKSVYPDKSVCVVKEIGDGVIPCAIPYMIRSLDDPAKNAMGNMPLDKAGVQIVVGKVVALNTESRSIVLDSGETMTYERLVLATGTDMILPPIPGIDKKGVYSIQKSMSAMTLLRKSLAQASHVAIIGGGFIGAEFADELSTVTGTEVHLIEILPKILTPAFDDEFCDAAADILKRSGVHIHTGCGVTAINGDDRVTSITVDGGREIPAEAVLVCVGAKSSSELAKSGGLALAEDGSIWVDEYMRTSADGVFAVGDCAVKRDFFTRKAVPVWLASTATAEARNAGTNVYGVRVLHQIHGTISAFSTRFGDETFASAGMTCRTCEREGFRHVHATAEAPDRHPGSLPGARPLKVKLIFADRSGILLGGQVAGGPSAGELINTVAVAIQKSVSVRELDMMQIATHPLLTPAPTVHPLVTAAHQALAKLRGK
jgi:NADH oxidase (H2O2-forming)